MHMQIFVIILGYFRELLGHNVVDCPGRAYARLSKQIILQDNALSYTLKK